MASPQAGASPECGDADKGCRSSEMRYGSNDPATIPGLLFRCREGLDTGGQVGPRPRTCGELFRSTTHDEEYRIPAQGCSTVSVRTLVRGFSANDGISVNRVTDKSRVAAHVFLERAEFDPQLSGSLPSQMRVIAGADRVVSDSR